MDIRECLLEETYLHPRRVLALIKHLPVESAFVSAQLPGGAENRGWSVTARLLADANDYINQNSWVTVKSANPKAKIPKIDPVPRPGDEAKKKAKPNRFAIQAGKHIAIARKAKELKNAGSRR